MKNWLLKFRSPSTGSGRTAVSGSEDAGARSQKPVRAELVEAPRPSSAASAEHILRRLEWSVIRRLDGLLQGDYRTLMRGSGLDLADLREYQHQDDVRHIDWNV
ncbi:MAG: DUF58 domain-containing protein, partial [Pseudomonadota bacterium]